MSTNITKRLRGIWHAWHFQFALSLVFKVLCRNLCISCLHPLTRRYVACLSLRIFDISSAFAERRCISGSSIKNTYLPW
ncbi:DUF3265 domain-containing protein [Vibrio parahaemolyticus]|nr:DUF3265 domain-containing protein [Vibrio parahaemolyticus]